MKIIILLLAVCISLSFAGCGRPTEETKAFIDAKDDVILQMSKKLEASPTAAGVEEAQKVFDSKKENLKAKKDALQAKSDKLNSDLRIMLSQSESNDYKYFLDMKVKFGVSCKGDDCQKGKDKLDALEKDYNNIVKLN